MTTFSVCLIVRNEEANIGRVLKSIPKHFEIIVGDTGSTDRTMEIAQSLKANVFTILWNDNFAQARNATAAHATGSYILFLDADEELQAGAEAVLRNFVKKHPNEAGAVTIRNLIADEIHVHQMARFYPNNGRYQYSGPVHETVYQGETPAECYRTGLVVTHYGYEHAEYTSKNKAERYFNMYEKYLVEHPNDGYMLYQLGKLHFSLKHYEQALSALTQCIRLQEESQLYFPVMAVMLGYSLKYLNRSQDAEQLLTPYLDKYPTFPDLPFLLGLLAMDTGKIAEIEQYFLKAITMGDTEQFTSVYGTGSFKAAYNLGVFYEITGRTDTARKYYRQAVLYNYEPAKARLKILKKNIKN